MPCASITGLPQTAYARLVGRDAELQRLDAAWADATTNVLSLVAEGGAGKSALVNEWLRRLQADAYRGAETVLGWSFYSQGSKERAIAADDFLDWALDRLGIGGATTSATAKGEAIAAAILRRPVLLLLDGVEPLQHGPLQHEPGRLLGRLKDQGLRALLRRVAAAPPGEARGLIVLTSRVAVRDIARWRDGGAPVVDVGRLSDEAGAALLRDNGVQGADKELEAAARDLGGHPLALGLLASFLTETQAGDVRRRDRVRAHLPGADAPLQDHARRVMDSYEKEWLSAQPVLLAVLHMVGLFDRPAGAGCLAALRAEPAIAGLTDEIVDLDDGQWLGAIARLRELRLLAPADPAAAHALDAHPLVREWFGERLRRTNEAAWSTAHGRLYEHLRDTTMEGREPTLARLAPLYQAIAHGCRAGRHEEALTAVFVDRICRRSGPSEIEFYAVMKLGAGSSDLAALSWFFTHPYETPVAGLSDGWRAWVLGQAGYTLRNQGRFIEAIGSMAAAAELGVSMGAWSNAATSAANLSETELILGNIAAASSVAERAAAYADTSGDKYQMMARRADLANARNASGDREGAERLFREAERSEQELAGDPRAILGSLRGFQYCDLLLDKRAWAAVETRAAENLRSGQQERIGFLVALHRLALARAQLGRALDGLESWFPRRSRVSAAGQGLDRAVEELRHADRADLLPRALLARAAWRRSVGDWEGAARDLAEVEEIAGQGPMRLFLCDMALERARLALARSEAFAPLNGRIEGAASRPRRPDGAACSGLREDAARQLGIAADLVAACGYHRRRDALGELQAGLRGNRAFADLPPRV